MQNGTDLLTRSPALGVAAKRAGLQRSLHLSPGPVSARLRADGATAARAAAAMWRREPSGWSAAADVQAIIANRLGWLDSPALMADSIDRLRTFADDVKRNGFTDVVLLGRGGSSLAPEVLRSIVGTASGWPRLHMLDSTDPAAIRAAATTASTDAVSGGQHVRHHDRTQHARGSFPSDARARRRCSMGQSFRRHHRRRDGVGAPRPIGTLS